MFKNLDHDLQDGVTEEMMKHLKIVSENIVLIKNQNDIYGNQIADIKVSCPIKMLLLWMET